jgi:NAD+ synthase (glutamine-hydrolysing)
VSASGGIDSSVTLAMMMAAKKTEGSGIERVMAIAQPICSTESIQNRAYDVATALGAECITVNQTELHGQLSSMVDKALGVEGNTTTHLLSNKKESATAAIISQSPSLRLLHLKERH